MGKDAYKGFIYWDVRKAIYGLPQAGALANKQLHTREFETTWLREGTRPYICTHVSKRIMIK